jgi:hypothetical protein
MRMRGDVAPLTWQRVIELAEGPRPAEPVKIAWGWLVFLSGFAAGAAAVLLAWAAAVQVPLLTSSGPPGALHDWMLGNPGSGARAVAALLVVVFVGEVTVMLYCATRRPTRS